MTRHPAWRAPQGGMAMARCIGARVGLSFVVAGLSWAGAQAQPRPFAEPVQTQRSPSRIAPWVEANTVAFEPGADSFSRQALWDLRGLNEKVAGASGPVRVNAQGDFERGDGQPLRFWAVNTDVGRQPFQPRPLWPGETHNLAQHARFLAKRGVNLVRLHRQIPASTQSNPQAGLHDINQVERDGIWRTVAAMKAEGIYSAISPFWSHTFKTSAAWGLSVGAADSAPGLLFFDETLQRAYKAWLKALLVPPNPYTGVPLAQETALALFQIQNEDSLLFWTLDQVQGPPRRQLERAFQAFLMRKHGGDDGVEAAWLRDREAQEDRAQRRLLPVWEMTRNPQELSPGRRARLIDQTEFLARTMDAFNQGIVRYLRDDLGLTAPINAGNWKTASVDRLNDVERWSYRAGNVDAVNLYNAGLHEGKHAAWAITPGDTYTDASVLREPWRMPLALRQSAGRAMLVTEGSWVMPTQYGAEGPLVVAAFGGLLGVDGYVWFSLASTEFEAPRSANGYLPSHAKWSAGRPELLLGFPAAALAFRRGDVALAPPALHVTRELSSLWRRDLSAPAETASFDPNRDDAAQAWASASLATTAMSAFLKGPVVVQTPPSGGTVSASTAITRRQNQSVELNAAQGWLRVDTPRTQGVAAHFEQQPAHALSRVHVESNMPHGSVIVTALDDAPLQGALRVLVQVTTRTRPTGWVEQDTLLKREGQPSRPGRRIDHVGAAPWRQERHVTTVSIENDGLRRATAVDAHGMALRDVPVKREGGRLQVVVPPDVNYVVLRGPTP